MTSNVRPNSLSPGEAASPGALFTSRYRLVFYCFLLGLIGAAAAIAFEEAVRLAESLVLERLGRYRPPQPGSLPSASYVHE